MHEVRQNLQVVKAEIDDLLDYMGDRLFISNKAQFQYIKEKLAKKPRQ